MRTTRFATLAWLDRPTNNVHRSVNQQRASIDHQQHGSIGQRTACSIGQPAAWLDRPPTAWLDRQRTAWFDRPTNSADRSANEQRGSIGQRTAWLVRATNMEQAGDSPPRADLAPDGRQPLSPSRRIRPGPGASDERRENARACACWRLVDERLGGPGLAKTVAHKAWSATPLGHGGERTHRAAWRTTPQTLPRRFIFNYLKEQNCQLRQ